MDGECNGAVPIDEGVPGDIGPYVLMIDSFLARSSSSSTRISGTPSCVVADMTAFLFLAIWRLNCRVWYLCILSALNDRDCEYRCKDLQCVKEAHNDAPANFFFHALQTGPTTQELLKSTRKVSLNVRANNACTLLRLTEDSCCR